MTDTNTNTPTLASRAAGLLTKATAYAAAEKAMQQAIAARRVYPPLAADFGEQLGHDLPLKTRDFVAVVGHLLASSEKPLKGVISKKKSEIISVLSELVAALTDTAPIPLPAWAVPKVREKKEESPSAEGALERANAAGVAIESAEALASTAAQEAIAADIAARAAKITAQEVNDAVACIIAHVDALTEAQREMIRTALASTEPALM